MLRFLVVALGNGASTAISFATTVLLARTLDSSEFVVVNLVFTFMVIVTVAGGGVDSAAARIVAQGAEPRAAVRLAILPRILIVLLFALCFPLLLPSVTAAGIDPAVALTCAGAMCLGGSVLSLALIPALGSSNYVRYALLQVYFYLALGAAAVTAIFGGVDTVLPALIAVNVFILLGSSPFVWRLYREPVASRVASSFRRLAPALVASTIGFAVFERVDVVLVSALSSPEVAAAFGMAARFASALALMTGAFAAFATPRVAQCESMIEFRALLRNLQGPLALILIAAVALIPVTLIVLPVVFGPSTLEGTTTAACILALQFPLVAVQTPFALAFPHLGKRRWLLELVGLLILIKVIIVLIAQDSVLICAAAAPAAHAVGCVYALMRAKSFRTPAPSEQRDLH